jgi:hypothetical protein
LEIVTQPFLVFDVPLDAPEESEDLGTKEKFWFNHPVKGKCLFKKARPETGEAWSEKIAAELSELLNLPHASYELAKFSNEFGTLSPSFIPEGGNLFLGNEILSQVISSYPREENAPSQHTVAQVLETLERSSLGLPLSWIAPDGITNAVEVFVGYLLLDAWIGNTDRHHENWGVIRLEGQTYLAPTYDHASSLGRELRDEKRNSLSSGTYKRSVQTYVEKGPSCLYSEAIDAKPLKIYDAFCKAAKLYPKAANIWLDILATISADNTLALFQRIPGECISLIAIEFAQKILEINQNRLLEFKSQLQ